MRKKLNYKILIYNFIKKIFAFINIDIKFKKNLSFDEIYKKYIKTNPVIIDVGANEKTPRLWLLNRQGNEKFKHMSAIEIYDYKMKEHF